MTIKVSNTDWQTKSVKISDRTYCVLKNGKRVPTWTAMVCKCRKV